MATCMSIANSKMLLPDVNEMVFGWLQYSDVGCVFYLCTLVLAIVIINIVCYVYKRRLAV